MPFSNEKTHEIENVLLDGQFIKTSDAVGDMPATYRRVTTADRMRIIWNKVDKENKNKKHKEPLNWKMLIGLKQPL